MVMSMRRPGFPAAGLFVILALAACSAPDVAPLSKAGVTYAKALDAALQLGAKAEVEAGSETMLRSYREFARAAATCDAEADPARCRAEEGDAAAADLEKKRRENEKSVATYRGLRQQVAVFRTYFVQLGALGSASEDFKAQAKANIGNIGGKLGELTDTLAADAGLGDLVSSAGTAAANLAIGIKAAEDVKDELEARRETLFRAMTLQELLLSRLTAETKSRLEEIERKQLETYVVLPYRRFEIGNAAAQEAWAASRNRLILAPPSDQLKAVEEVEKAAKSFREKLKGVYEGRFEIADLINEAAEFEAIFQALRPLVGI